MGALFSKPKIDYAGLARQNKALKAQEAADRAEAKEKERRRQTAINAVRGGFGGQRSLLFAGPLGELGGARSLLA